MFKLSIVVFTVLLVICSLSVVTWAGNFSHTCRNIRHYSANGSNQAVLVAECKDFNGDYQETVLILNTRIANINGDLRWDNNGGRYIETCHTCEIKSFSNVAVSLQCECQKINGFWNITVLNLDEKIDNTNGNLIYQHSFHN